MYVRLIRVFLLLRASHQLWARAKLMDGWTYSETRDDSKKQHNCLLPFYYLSEAVRSVLGVGGAVQ